MEEFVKTLLLTGKMAVITTAVLFVFSLPIAYWLAYSKFKGKVIFEALVCMPMVLPPTVLGYYFLLLISPTRGFGKFLNDSFDIQLAFTFEGIVIASIIANLPFMIQPLQNGFIALPKSFKEAAYTLGKSRWTTFWRVLLPNIKPSIITGLALTFAHCIGEFGIVLMIGGSIPGETKIASIELYDQVQALNYDLANQYALILFAISFILLMVIFSINKRKNKNYL
ncbi:molybdate ABC transporter permease subunit [Capnocytophaga sputigena]|uniref:molybdate ABC transporter permease subunit n=1 Tax=Capnocytophaga sputigena TaxID=1019 RepID=UPI00288C326B|nr:molybdate ABC transporter permease subunit [Capnocytophaga sputigena]